MRKTIQHLMHLIVLQQREVQWHNNRNKMTTTTNTVTTNNDPNMLRFASTYLYKT